MCEGQETRYTERDRGIGQWMSIEEKKTKVLGSGSHELWYVVSCPLLACLQQGKVGV